MRHAILNWQTVEETNSRYRDTNTFFFSASMHAGVRDCVRLHPSQVHPCLSLLLLCFVGAVAAACRGLWKVNHTAVSTQHWHRGSDTNLISHHPTANTYPVLQRSLDESTLCKRPQRNPLTKVSLTYRRQWIRENILASLWKVFLCNAFRILSRKLFDLTMH